MVNLRQMKTFMVVAEEKSFTKASRELFMTQPAVSAQIKALEVDLGIQLIERIDKKVILTEAGEIFLKSAVKIMAIYNETTTALDEIKGVKRGRLKLGASNIPGEYLLPKYIGAFKSKYPHIEVSLKISDTGAIVDLLKQRKIELGIIGAKINEDEVEYDEFQMDELVVIAHPQNPLVGKKLHLKDFIESPLILREATSGTRIVILNHLKNLKISPDKLNLTMELGSTRAVITAVEANLGISIVSKWAAEEALKLKKISPLKIPELEIKRSLYIACQRNGYLSYASECFKNFLINSEIL